MKAPKVSSDCTAAAVLRMPVAHTRCPGNGPTYLPGTPAGGAPALPKIPCGCACHTAKAGR